MKSPLAEEFTVEQRTRIGYKLYLDSYEKQFQFTRELLSGQFDMEIRMAIFWSLSGRLIDLNSLEDAGEIFSDIYNSLIQEAKDWAQEHRIKQAKALMPFVTEEMMQMMTALMRQPEKPTIMKMQDWRDTVRADVKRKERAAQQQREQFNSQHKPAPEGTVKELAAKYGKSLGEIRKLKAAGLLHTLTEQQA